MPRCAICEEPFRKYAMLVSGRVEDTYCRLHLNVRYEQAVLDVLTREGRPMDDNELTPLMGGIQQISVILALVRLYKMGFLRRDRPPRWGRPPKWSLV